MPQAMVTGAYVPRPRLLALMGFRAAARRSIRFSAKAPVRSLSGSLGFAARTYYSWSMPLDVRLFTLMLARMGRRCQGFGRTGL